ncbi:MAG TPA: cyclopropane-fatty-acyl-phospholipid synthase family protein [Solirubrobacteraceae bacterium]|nr:cyclopropane-fatty-acyl-phospholipid synthase family protein [Solirubrobacteraceae bacterium]
MARVILSLLLRRIRTGTLTVVEDGERRVFGSGPPAATIIVRSPRMWRRALLGSRGLADAYADGLWDSPDVTALVRLAARNAPGLDRLRARIAPVRVPVQRARTYLTRSTRSRRRRDIAAHYDLGNALFSRMLDPTMSYSCGVFDDPATTLEDAQIAKLDLICDKLGLGPEDHLLEIGTGWGGLAIHAAGTRGCRVTTTTISREQHAYAVDAVRRAGLEARVTVLLTDYRDLTGRYDKLVSIEMIEAVGWRHTGTFFAKCSELLADNGAMLLQAITIDDRAYDIEKASRSFINTHIFPGGCLPSLEMIARDLARRTDMQTVGLEDLTSHYVETLRRWRTNFAANADALGGLGYDERFRRLWALYLAYCEAGFAERRICDVQLLLAKPRYRPLRLCRFAEGRFTAERTTGQEGDSWRNDVSVRRTLTG